MRQTPQSIAPRFATTMEIDTNGPVSKLIISWISAVYDSTGIATEAVFANAPSQSTSARDLREMKLNAVRAALWHVQSFAQFRPKIRSIGDLLELECTGALAQCNKLLNVGALIAIAQSRNLSTGIIVSRNGVRDDAELHIHADDDYQTCAHLFGGLYRQIRTELFAETMTQFGDRLALTGARVFYCENALRNQQVTLPRVATFLERLRQLDLRARLELTHCPPRRTNLPFVTSKNTDGYKEALAGC